MKKLVVFITSLVFYIGCSGGGAGDTPVAIQNSLTPIIEDTGEAPSFNYPTPSNMYTKGTVISSNIPLVTGDVVTWKITPVFSNGLSFNLDNGTISGTPTSAQSATNYTIEATNEYGTSSATISISVIVPDPTITYTATKTITPIPIGTDFYYSLDSDGSIWYYKTKTLTKADCTYTVTTKTYTNGILTNTVTSGLLNYSLDDFFSIGTGASKILYFTIASINYKQDSGVISEVVTLPTRPVKSRVTGSTTNFTMTYNSYTDYCKVQGYNSSNTFQTRIITDYIESYCPLDTGYGSAFALFTNVSIGITDVPVGLYYLRRSSTAGVTGVMIKAGKGEMW